MVSKILNWVKLSQYHIFLASCIGLIAFISYNLGQIDALKKSPLTIKQGMNSKKPAANLEADIFSAAQLETNQKSKVGVLDTRVVVSKASTSKKYHYVWCPGAKKINEANKVWFNSDKEAETAGYTLAGNCEK